MEVYYSLKKSPDDTCVALGFFDGMHIGHQEVIRRTVEKALLTHIIPTVFTFSQNPKSILKNVEIKNISTQSQKENLLYKHGINLLYCVNFLDIMNLSPIEFIEKILVDTLQTKYVFCGYNFNFGKNASANADDLVKICQKYDIEVFVIEPVKFNGISVSSTQIRELILNGEIGQVDILLRRNK